MIDTWMWKCVFLHQFVKKSRQLERRKMRQCGCKTYLYQGVTRANFICYFKHLRKEPMKQAAFSLYVHEEKPKRLYSHPRTWNESKSKAVQLRHSGGKGRA